MPIPAVPAQPVSQEWVRDAFLPIPEDWQNTYVSITGSNGQGVEIPLVGFVSSDWPAIMLQPGATGLDMPPFELHTDDSPNLDGSICRGTRASARNVLLPVFVYGQDRKTFIQFKRNLANALNPKNGYCVLKFLESDGIPRYLNCYYAGGMDGDESVGTSGFRFTSYGIQLTAFDPWWYGDITLTDSWTFGAPSTFLGNPNFFPMVLAEGQRAGQTVTVSNPGDIEAWPVWQISGPILSISFTGPDGSTWSLPARADGYPVVAAGRTLTVDTRPGFKTLQDDQGTNYYPALAAGPVLWSIPSGQSTIGITAQAGSGTPSVVMTINPRYASY